MIKSLIVLAFLMFVAVILFACPNGCTEIASDTCACEATEEKAPAVQPSDEEPPSHGGVSIAVHADTPPSLAGQDAKEDAERQAADDQGKAAAGLP